MWVGSGYQKEADTIGFWYKLLIAELPFEKIRTRQISSEAESSSTPVSQCPPSVSEQVSWCPPGAGECHDPKLFVSRSHFSTQWTLAHCCCWSSNFALPLHPGLPFLLCLFMGSSITKITSSIWAVQSTKAKANLLIMFGSHLNCINYFWNGFFSLGLEWMYDL